MDRLRVLTLNIWHRSGSWEARAALIRRGIERLQPDLIALQEVLRLDGPGGPDGDDGQDQADELAAGLGYHKAYARATTIGGEGSGLHFGNAVLSRHPISRVDRRPLPFHGEDEPRGLLGVIAETPAGPVPFFSTHLNWKLHHGAIRQRQVAFIASAIADLAPVGDERLHPPILAGDFNAEPFSDEIRFLRGWHAIDGRTVYYADCFAVAGEGRRDVLAGPTYAPSRNAYAAETHEPDRRLDYIFVRGPDRLVRGEPLAARVVFDEPEDGVWASDHFGVYAEISVGSVANKATL